MSYRIKDVSGATEPVSLATAKLQLKELPDDTEDTLLQTWIKAARREVERMANRPLVNKDITFEINYFENERIFLPVPTEEATISELTYIDEAGDPGTIDPSEIYLGNIPVPNYIEMKTGEFPSNAKRVQIKYVATARLEDIEGLTPSILLLVAFYYQNRSIVPVPSNSNIRNSVLNFKRYTQP